jgi:protein-S-isoprenylcysteine O-methyltransferase Ste14/pimeloyl-ACP methyl ester carboxylesterase
MTRALVASLALPGLAAAVVPLVLVWLGAGDPPFRPMGLLPLVPGAALLLWCARELLTAGYTRAPWDQPRRLVTSGPYRISRHPMYVAVALVLAGWAIGFASAALWLYAGAVVVAFHLFVVTREEPALARAFRDDWTRYASRVPRWIPTGRGGTRAPVRWSAATVLLAGAGLLVLLAGSGLIYEAFAEGRDARDFPPPGVLVDLGGRQIHLLCLGEGEPTVVIESAGWGTALGAREVRERIATRTRVCGYDPRGRGWSDPAPGAASAADLASDLGVLQDRALRGSPLILVGVSIGGLTTEMFARHYPERVAGLVFVDAASSLSLPLLTPQAGGMTRAACARSPLAYVGVIRLMDPFGFWDGSEDGRRNAALTYSARAWSGLCAMARGMRANPNAFNRAPPLDPDIPLTVLSATNGGDVVAGFGWLADEMRPAFIESHQHLARQSTRGTWQMVPESTHLIAESQPDAVAEAVLEMVEQDRTQRPRLLRGD